MEIVFGVVLVAVGIGGVVFARTHGWTCQSCGSERDFFETPWIDERGVVGMCCLEEKAK